MCYFGIKNGDFVPVSVIVCYFGIKNADFVPEFSSFIVVCVIPFYILLIFTECNPFETFCRW